MSFGESLFLQQLSLNKDQYRAVTHPQDVPLQILAGPGSGKTKVLTSRVAFLVRERRVPPSQICCVTFTNKAANEMRERLKKIIGVQQTDALVMGTFHALCARFLRKYGSRISLQNNFTICDAQESKKIISKIMKSNTHDSSVMHIQLTEATVLASISKAKAKGLAPHQLAHAKTPPDPVQEIISRIYADYAAVLAENNSLDFDDLLLFGVELFIKNPDTVSWCKHVLVDEFQDTNSMQYKLMICLASAHKCVTVVGDPDQSIYGWRSADITNLHRMRTDFPSTHQILLEENYRSTGSILEACLAIVAEDKSRVAKSLRTSHPRGPLPTLGSFASEQREAESIAAEIKRLVVHHGGLLGWNDFAVLLRFNALSRVLEAALQKEGIPNRVLAGQKFFERLEIKDILAYLQVIDNPKYTPAFDRAVNTPPRGIGGKTLSELSSRAKTLKFSPMELAERIYIGVDPDIKPAVQRKLEGFCKSIVTLRKMAYEGASVPDLIRRLLVQINYEDHLKKSQNDWETRWENVQELINFASQPVNGLTGSATESAESRSHPRSQREGEVIDLIGDDENNAIISRQVETPLRLFLQASMLSTDTETDESQEGEKVTISTCHSAKGLEWPVVFVPAVEKGTFPFSRADDIEEERRLLYVACTRAQGLLYLSHSTRRMTRGEWASKNISEFVSAVVKKNKGLFSQSPPNISAKERQEMARLLSRQQAGESIVHGNVQEYQTTKPLVLRTQAFGKTTLPTTNDQRKMPNAAPVPSNFTSASSSTPFLPLSHHHSNIPSRSCTHPIYSMPSLNPEGLPGSSAAILNANGHISNQVPSKTALTHVIKLAAGKRRLGMGRIGTGYSNKRFKDT